MPSRYFIGILLFIILFCCQEDKELARPYPVVNTLSITEISKDGAVFNAEITSENLSDIIEHGFIWAADKNAVLNLDNSLLVKLGLPTTTNVSAVVNSALESNKEYKVRSYLKTKNKIIYGKVVTFFSLGSFGPILLSANPGEGALGDTIKLIGKNFSFKTEKNIVKFGDIQASVVQSSDTEMRVVIPEDVNSLTPLVSISIDENISKLSKTFNINGPQIFSVTPENPSPCDTIFITGNHFPRNPLKNQVLFDNKAARITKVSEKEIQVLAFVTDGPIKSLKVKSGGLEVLSSVNINQKLPEITQEILLSDTLVIHGKNLPICYDDLAISLVMCNSGNGCGYYYPKVLSKNESEIKLIMDNQVCITPTVRVNFLSGNDLIYDIKNVMVTQPKIISVSPVSGSYSDEIVIRLENTSSSFLSTIAVSIGGPSRILTRTKNEIHCKLYEFVSAPNGFVDVELNGCKSSIIVKDGFYLKPPKIFDFSPKEITNTSDQLIITGENFSPFNNNIVKVGDKVISDLNNTSFSDNKIIVNNSEAIIGDLYLTTTNTYPITVISGGQIAAATNLVVSYKGMWTKLNDFTPIPRAGAASFSINGKGYIVSGQSATGFLNDVWEYDPAIDLWSRKADFPGAGRINSNITVLNGKAYFGLGVNGNNLNDWWEFDIANNSWTRKLDFPGNAPTGSFEINNYGYVIGDFDLYTQLTDFWQYDQIKNQWKQMGKLPGNVRKLAFSYNGLGHAFSSVNFEYKHYAYNPINDHWEIFDDLIPYFVDAYSMSLFQFQGRILVIAGNSNDLRFFDYDLIQKTISPVNYLGSFSLHPISFNINNLFYLGSGLLPQSNVNTYLKDFWEIDPSKINP